MNNQQVQNDTVKVTIYGQEYPIKTNGSNEDYIRRGAGYVDEMMSQIDKQNSIFSTTRLAVLAALNIADELFALKGESENLVKSYEEKTRQILENLEMK